MHKDKYNRVYKKSIYLDLNICKLNHKIENVRRFVTLVEEKDVKPLISILEKEIEEFNSRFLEYVMSLNQQYVDSNYNLSSVNFDQNKCSKIGNEFKYIKYFNLHRILASWFDYYHLYNVVEIEKEEEYCSKLFMNINWFSSNLKPTLVEENLQYFEGFENEK